jgi:hypothetical protein
MAWAYPLIWAVGTEVTSSDLNTYVSGNENFLATPPWARVYLNSGSYSLVGSQVVTLLPYDTVQYDTASGFNTSTHEYTTQVSGWYLVNGALTAPQTSVGIQILPENITQGVQYAGKTTIKSNGFNLTAGVKAIIQCNLNDVLAMYYVAETSATAVNAASQTYMGLMKVSN